MALALNYHSDLLVRLGRVPSAAGGAELAGELLRRLVGESGLDADVVLGSGGRDSWDVEVAAGETAVALVDVVAERHLDRLDRVEAKANRRWRRVQRGHDPLRPWIGVVVVGQTNQSVEIDVQVGALIRCRTLDAAFSNARHVRTTEGVLGIQSFAAALLGRLVYVRTVESVAPAMMRP